MNMGLPWGVAILISVVINTVIGFLTGVIINKTKIIPMIGTLAISNLVSGVAYIICNGLPNSCIPNS